MSPLKELLALIIAMSALNNCVNGVVTITKSKDVMHYNVDTSKVEGNLRHFWRSTGQSPPSFRENMVKNYLLSMDEGLNIALIGSLPNSAIKQVRIHWLLNLISINVSEDKILFNFTHLDYLLDQLHEAGLNPGFELMGNPSNIFDNFENLTQVSMWTKMVHDLATHYAKRYGIKRVSEWNWESWNEPDHHDFGNINFTEQGFLNYFDASRKGLKSAWQNFRFGGPGGSCRDPNFSKLCWKLFKHCNDASRINRSASDILKIDFISFHKKGSEDVDSILQAEKEVILNISNYYPNLKKSPFYNDEGDFLKGWLRSRSWKANGVYAAMVAKSIIDHAYFALGNPRYKLLSFDNAFLNHDPDYYFTQRTLFARFRTGSNKEDVVFFKKPSYQIMAVASLLGNKILGTSHHIGEDRRISILATTRESIPHRRKGRKYGRGNFVKKYTTNRRTFEVKTSSHTKQDHLSPIDNLNNVTSIRKMIKTQNAFLKLTKGTNNVKVNYKRKKTRPKYVPLRDDEISILLSFTNGTANSGEVIRINTNLVLGSNVLDVPLYIAVYDIGSAEKMGPFEAWKILGMPKRPTKRDIAFLRSYEGINRQAIRREIMQSSSLELKVTLTLASVKLIHICSLRNIAPPQIAHFKVGGVTATDILFVWSDENIRTRCVAKYEVYISKRGPRGPFHRISKRIILQNNYFYSISSKKGMVVAAGWYTVRATLYNAIKGPFANPIYFYLRSSRL